ncbi:EAL domain-containing protein [Phyllobacterium sp. A18/5-2]|uniref:EAL domain-containing protein n=1 Tax=Phyllobacterium sp. A18/5-2 TaxID=2978392 RepID=UPI003965ABEB
MNTITREICGYEALLRWFHPIRGQVSPSEFIPVAENIGLIHELRNWVLGTACLEATRWPRSLKVAVNLSPVQFRSQNLIQSIVTILTQSGLDPNRLELGITESVLLDKNEQTFDTLTELKAVGIHAIAIDRDAAAFRRARNVARCRKGRQMDQCLQRRPISEAEQARKEPNGFLYLPRMRPPVSVCMAHRHPLGSKCGPSLPSVNPREWSDAAVQPCPDRNSD